MKVTQVDIAQVRAGRALLGWTQAALARRAHVGPSMISDFERGARLPVPNSFNAICEALEKGGVRFIPGGVVRK